ncbi:MAG TPA: hypothetical protein PKM88_12865, partial [bacterium]|nr:hypothetical protein [bacterium]
MQLSKTNLILLLVLALAGSLIWFYERKLPSTEERLAGEGMLFTARTAEDVTAVAFAHADTVWTIQRNGPVAETPELPGMAVAATGGQWRLTAPYADDADPVTAERVVEALLSGLPV